jgi:hypothetical protein
MWSIVVFLLLKGKRFSLQLKRGCHNENKASFRTSEARLSLPRTRSGGIRKQIIIQPVLDPGARSATRDLAGMAACATPSNGGSFKDRTKIPPCGGLP